MTKLLQERYQDILESAPPAHYFCASFVSHHFINTQNWNIDGNEIEFECRKERYYNVIRKVSRIKVYDYFLKS